MLEVFPLESEFSILEFVIRRFTIELGTFVSKAMGKEVTIASATHSEYLDPEDGFVADIPDEIKARVDAGVPKAKLPAITIADFTETSDNVKFKNCQELIDKKYVVNGELIEGKTKLKPIEIWDIDLTLRVYSDDLRELQLMKRLVAQYLSLVPYLFIPNEIRKDWKPPTKLQLETLLSEWFQVEDQDLSIPGFFITQGFASRSQRFSTSIRASADNVQTAEAAVLLEGIPVPDLGTIGNYGTIQSFHIEITPVDDDEVVYATIEEEID